MIETSKDIDPAWQILVQDLQAYGISHDVVEENVDFVEGFLAGAKLAKTRPTGTETKVVKVDLASDKRMCLTISLYFILFVHIHACSPGKEKAVSKETPQSID